MDPDVRSIRDTAERWVTAVADADIPALRELMTEDIVVIHGNGRVVQGRDAVADDFGRGLADARVVQKVNSHETILAGEWAFDRADVSTVITPRAGGEATRLDSRAITLLKRDGPRWRVARAIGVVVQGAGN